MHASYGTEYIIHVAFRNMENNSRSQMNFLFTLHCLLNYTSRYVHYSKGTILGHFMRLSLLVVSGIPADSAEKELEGNGRIPLRKHARISRAQGHCLLVLSYLIALSYKTH